jgi:tetratricopeptide (TPR) repeat protein
MRYRGLLLTAVLLGVLLAHHPALAVSPYDDVLVQKALKDLEQENFDEAVEALTQAWQKGTRTPEKAFLLGRAYRSLLNYPKARKYLEEARRLKPNFPQAQLLLADTLVALDRPKEAEPLLKQLLAVGFEPGQTAFLLGMIKAKEGNYQEALDHFRKAQEDPRLAQDAKFQASLALAALNRLKEARKTLEESISLDTTTQTADFAQRYMGLLERRLHEVRPFRFNVAVGFDFDSNVTLQPGGAGAAQQVSGRGDVVYTQTATLEYLLFPTQPFSVMAQYSYFENFHPRITTYDAVSHTMSLVPTYSTGNSRLWVPFSFNYMDVQNDKYYVGYLVTPTYLYLLTPAWGLEVGGRLNRKYYWPVGLTGPPLQQDDRTARNVGGSLGLYYFFKKQQGYLQARFSYEHDFANGSNWDASGYRLFLNTLYPLTEKLKFNVFLDLLLQPFDHRFFDGNPFVVNPKREDRTLIVGAQATYNVYKGLDFNVHYYFVRDDSNIALYDYKRHIVGCQVGYRY